MTRYIVRRILLTIPVLFGIVSSCSSWAGSCPASSAAAILGERATPAACAAFDHAHGFDRPIPVQFVDLPRRLCSSGDLGTSIKASTPVTDCSSSSACRRPSS